MSWKDFLNPGAGIIGSLANVGSTMAANAYNLRNAREQRAFERQQWMMQTAYNHPKAQMERLISAGLNPNLAMGDSGNMSNQPSFTGPTQAIPPQIDPMLLSQIEVNNAQAENLRADADLKNTEVRETESRVDLNNAKIIEIESSVEYNRVLADYQRMKNDAVKVMDYFRDYFSAEVNKLRTEIILNSMRSDVLEQDEAAKFLANFIAAPEAMYNITGVYPVIKGDGLYEFYDRFGIVFDDDKKLVREWKAWDPYLDKLKAALEKPVFENAVDAALALLHGALSNLYSSEKALVDKQGRFLSLNTVLTEIKNMMKYNPETGEYTVSIGGETYIITKDVAHSLGEIFQFNTSRGKRTTTVTR